MELAGSLAPLDECDDMDVEKDDFVVSGGSRFEVSAMRAPRGTAMDIEMRESETERSRACAMWRLERIDALCARGSKRCD